jgi:myosin heavy subunit
MLQEEEQEETLEEATHFEYDPESDALGVWRHNRSREEFNADMAELLYEEESEEEEDVNEELMGQVNDLHETVDSLTQQNSQLERVLTKLEMHLEETLLSNAKLLYQNRTLADASLNERQKSKIVEAIANAESPKEAKKLHETLKATVGSTPNSKRDPQSLSESVNRRSNLSSMLNSRQNINESKSADNPFMEKMQKLAGIKK